MYINLFQECAEKMKRYYAQEPGQPLDVMYTHIEFTLKIEYNLAYSAILTGTL